MLLLLDYLLMGLEGSDVRMLKMLKGFNLQGL